MGSFVVSASVPEELYQRFTELKKERTVSQILVSLISEWVKDEEIMVKIINCKTCGSPYNSAKIKECPKCLFIRSSKEIDDYEIETERKIREKEEMLVSKGLLDEEQKKKLNEIETKRNEQMLKEAIAEIENHPEITEWLKKEPDKLHNVHFYCMGRGIKLSPVQLKLYLDYMKEGETI